ncbi:MAG TPA: HAMP domain-containing sensor histidine kinase [Pyrinomonadaceae bacterium]|jgi:signal transduction histidine kinase
MNIIQKIKGWFPFLNKKAEHSEEDNNFDFSAQNPKIGKNELETLGILASSIEHDVKNPLNVIQAEIYHMGRRFQHNEEVLNFLNRIEEQTQRIYAALQVIPLFRGEKFYEQNLKKVSLNEIVWKSISDVRRGMIDDSNIFFKKGGYLNEGNLKVKAYAPLLQQAIINVLKNAIEAIHETKRKNGVIYINVRKNRVSSEKFVIIEITDNGCGMAEVDVEKLTTLYTTKDHKKPNSGLGLFFTKRILSIHSGEIRIESEFGKGTTVSLILPELLPELKHRH